MTDLLDSALPVTPASGLQTPSSMTDDVDAPKWPLSWAVDGDERLHFLGKRIDQTVWNREALQYMIDMGIEVPYVLRDRVSNPALWH